MGHAWRVRVWCLGVLLLLLSVLTAFVGYVLPWGQMSFWGATVITSLASALPVVGYPLVSWLWGGLSVENATLNRHRSPVFEAKQMLRLRLGAPSVSVRASESHRGCNERQDLPRQLSAAAGCLLFTDGCLV